MFYHHASRRSSYLFNRTHCEVGIRGEIESNSTLVRLPVNLSGFVFSMSGGAKQTETN